MKLTVEFKYACEIEIKPEEAKRMTEQLNDSEFRDYTLTRLNDIFLSNDGRTEAGTIKDFKYQIKP